MTLTWNDVFRLLGPFDQPGQVIYGIPRGGMIAAGFLRKATITHDPALATLFLDDIVDSGRTRERYAEQYPGVPFVSLVEKGKEWIVFPWENETGPEDAVVRLMEYIGEDPKREGLQDTPGRVVRSWDTLYSGYKQDPGKLLRRSFDSTGYDEMIVLKDIEFYSTCEHHLLPFFGKAKIGYIPGTNGRVVGISKLARLVDCFARRLQIQERMTRDIANTIQVEMNPLGVGVVLEAKHLCMVARGVQKQNSIMSTSCLLGAMREKPEARQEFLSR